MKYKYDIWNMKCKFENLKLKKSTWERSEKSLSIALNPSAAVKSVWIKKNNKIS